MSNKSIAKSQLFYVFLEIMSTDPAYCIICAFDLSMVLMCSIEIHMSLLLTSSCKLCLLLHIFEHPLYNINLMVTFARKWQWYNKSMVICHYNRQRNGNSYSNTAHFMGFPYALATVVLQSFEFRCTVIIVLYQGSNVLWVLNIIAWLSEKARLYHWREDFLLAVRQTVLSIDSEWS